VKWANKTDPNLALNLPFKTHWYYPDLTPAIEPLVRQVYHYVGATELAGVLATRIPAGKQIYPHADGGYHAKTFSKYLVCIQANQEQSFCFKEAELRTVTGECFFFDNSHVHWVLNPSKEDRISLIICVRTPRGIHHP
jgi:hypothetical protein